MKNMEIRDPPGRLSNIRGSLGDKYLLLDEFQANWDSFFAIKLSLICWILFVIGFKWTCFKIFTLDKCYLKNKLTIIVNQSIFKINELLNTITTYIYYIIINNP